MIIVSGRGTVSDPAARPETSITNRVRERLWSAREGVPPRTPSGSTIVRREPVGVVGAITPCNYPQVLAMFKIAPALAAGCTIVLKPSPETALDSSVFGDAAVEAGLKG
jgi:acyl-CoA reductase-like NAD-dependent aldehyde dehydrogenase